MLKTTRAGEMSGDWDSLEPTVPEREAAESRDVLPPVGPPATLTSPDLPAGPPEPEKTRSFPTRIVAAGLVVVIALAAVGVVITVNANASGIKGAFASVFASQSVKVVISAHSANPLEEAVAGRYSVVLTVTNEKAGQPLSAPGAMESYEISVFRGQVDLGDIIVEHGAAFGRVDLRAMEPRLYAGATNAVAAVPPGPARDLASAIVRGGWVGISDKTINSLTKRLSPGAPLQLSDPKLAKIRGAFTMSLAQSWDAWASIHRLSSANGVTEYSVKLPVQRFVSTLLVDFRASLLKDLPRPYVARARAELGGAAAAVGRISPGLEIPMTLSVKGGSLTRLVIVHKGDSIDLAISHPRIGVAAPRDAAMVTASMLQELAGGASRSTYSLRPSTSSPWSGGSASRVSGISASPALSVSGATATAP